MKSLKLFSILLLLSACSEPAADKGLEPLGRQVAHALGLAPNGAAYLNCLECFEESYAKGFRYFEADLWRTSDGQVVLFHPGFEKRYGLTKGFTYAQFMATRPEGYTPLSLAAFAELLEAHPDAYVVLDAKYGVRAANLAMCQALGGTEACGRRVLPFLYQAGDYARIGAHDYSRVIALFTPDNTEHHNALVDALSKPNVVAAAVLFRSYAAALPAWNSVRRSTGAQIAVWGTSRVSHAFNNGADAVITDDWSQ